MSDTIQPVSKARLDWLDAAKGAAILLVVFGHALRGIEKAGLVNSELFVAVDSRIYAFHMPVFFAISGWFFNRSLAKVSVGDFTIARLKKLVWPMFLWAYLFLGIKVFAGTYTNEPTDLSDLFIIAVPGILHLWFLWALFVLNMAFAVLRPFLRDQRLSVRTLWVVTGCVAVAQFVSIPSGLEEWIGDAVRYSPYFFMGLVLGQSGWLLTATPRFRIACTLIFTVIIVFWPHLATNGIASLGSLVLTFCFMAIFSGIGPIASSAIMLQFCRLGVISMAVYMAHTIFSAGIREMLLVFGITQLSAHLIAGTLAGIFGPIGFLLLTQRTRTASFFGFR